MDFYSRNVQWLCLSFGEMEGESNHSLFLTGVHQVSFNNKKEEIKHEHVITCFECCFIKETTAFCFHVSLWSCSYIIHLIYLTGSGS